MIRPCQPLGPVCCRCGAPAQVLVDRPYHGEQAFCEAEFLALTWLPAGSAVRKVRDHQGKRGS